MNLFWFRDDLRITDNTGLWHACQSGPVVALYVMTPEQWKRHQMAPVRADFLLRNLAALSEALAALNIPLLIRRVARFEDCPDVLAEVCSQHAIQKMFVNRQYAVNEVERDRQVNQRLASDAIGFASYHDFLVQAPGEVIKDDGSAYRVFTPFKKAWLARLSETGGRAEPLPPPQRQDALRIESDGVPESVDGFDFEGGCELWPHGERAARERLSRFIDEALDRYKDNRDFPAKPGTSQLSPYLALGVISARQCFNAALNANGGELFSGSKGALTWMSELIWREFYSNLLFHYPELCKYKPFKPETDRIAWRDSDTDFAAWAEGRTGVPIVDAAMRELAETGWMHNRCRMIVAMFFSKNLLLDWRRGERWFMEHLIDGDLAQNNGGWQWSASTGTDAAPYFRIFNPFSQAEKFDPDAEYIKRHVPELTGLSAADIHKPERLARCRPENYPPVMVDLKQTRAQAIEVFRALA